MEKHKIIITEEFKEVLKKINSEISILLLKDEIDPEILSNPDKNFNYIDLSQTTKGHLSYLNKERIERIESENGDYWEVKKRYHCRPGSLMKKLFKLNDYEISHFTNQFIALVDPPIYEMKVVEGEDIAKFYNYRNYNEQCGSLGNSCMKSASPDFFKLYTDNPKQIKMLIMLNQHDKILGRAILWIGEDFQLMDRIYINNDLHLNYFYKWAKENNTYYKEFNNWSTPISLVFNDTKEIKKLSIKLNKSKFEIYPYLDTFKWLNLSNNMIYNYIPESNHKDDFIVLNDYTGKFLPFNYYKMCEISNSIYLSSDVLRLDYINMNVYIGHVNRSFTLNKYILKEHSKYLKEIDDYIFEDKFEHLNDQKLIELKKKELKEKSLKIDSLYGESSNEINWTEWEYTPQVRLTMTGEQIRE